MANLSSTAYDTVSSSASAAFNAMRPLKKLMEESRVTHAPAAATVSENETQTIETRFGSVSFNKHNTIKFGRGLLGMPERQQFVLADFPSPKFAQFKLLQSAESAETSFITMPLELAPELIAAEDLQRACDDTGIAFSSLVVLLIVTVHRTPDKVTMSVNLRAPLLVDANARQAVQYVFPHDRYRVQHVLNG